MVLNFLEAMLDKINKNSNYCLETLSADIDQLECMNDFVHAVKRKSKSSSETPVKRRRQTKKPPIDLPQEEEDESAEPIRKIAKPNAAKAFIREEADEAEG